jgi:hypothetical protein
VNLKRYIPLEYFDKSISIFSDLTVPFNTIAPSCLMIVNSSPINFESTKIETTSYTGFEPETMNAHELQQTGWQIILDNFKRHAESL